MKFKKFSPYLLIFLAACAQVPKNADVPLKARVEKRYSEDEALYIKFEKNEIKTWVFEQPVKIRLSPNPSAKILESIDEGNKVIAAIKSMGNGWSFIELNNGTRGFFFGKFAREISK